MQTVASIDPGPEHTEFAGALADFTSDRLFEAQRAVERMVDSDGWRVLTDLLDGRRDAILRQLLRDKPFDSAAEYAQRNGKLAGIAMAQAAVEAVLLKARDKQDQLEAQVNGRRASS
jgi:hypothetical protein